MNREDIVKALEYTISCINGRYRSIDVATLSATLALIRELDKELVEAHNKNVELIKENAQLKFFDLVTVRQTAEFFKEQYLKAKADTVRKMQDRLKAETITIQDHTGKLGSVVLIGTIDQIAKEMLEDDVPSDNSVKAETLSDLQTRFAMHFGTYTEKDTIKVNDVFKLLSKFKEEILEG